MAGRKSFHMPSSIFTEYSGVPALPSASTCSTASGHGSACLPVARISEAWGMWLDFSEARSRGADTAHIAFTSMSCA